jgi:hypothetical protein
MSTPNNPYALSAWGATQFSDLTVPSGQLCQVRLPGVQNLIAAGVIDNVDTLTTLVDKKHLKRVQGKAKEEAAANGQLMPDGTVIDPEAVLKDPENLTRVFSLVDKVVTYMVVQPTILPTPEDAHDRLTVEKVIELGQVYVDMIDLADKMYIFQYSVGGGTDLERFRKQFATGVGSVAAQQSV